MPSVFSHPAVPAALAIALGKKRIPPSLWQAGMISSVLPDADCASFAFGIPYESQFGHRGFTHSIFFALALAALWAWRNMEFEIDGERVKRAVVFPFIFISTVSHPLFDALTDGGEGVALFWPVSDERIFFPWHVIPVSPIGGSFLSARGLHVFTAEFALVWLPCLLIGMAGFAARRLLEKEKTA